MGMGWEGILGLCWSEGEKGGEGRVIGVPEDGDETMG